MEPEIHDVVELTHDFGRWPAGTCGTIVDDFPGGYVLEIVAPSGGTLDMIDVQAGSVHPLQTASDRASSGAAIAAVASHAWR